MECRVFVDPWVMRTPCLYTEAARMECPAACMPPTATGVFPAAECRQALAYAAASALACGGGS